MDDPKGINCAFEFTIYYIYFGICWIIYVVIIVVTPCIILALHVNKIYAIIYTIPAAFISLLCLIPICLIPICLLFSCSIVNFINKKIEKELIRLEYI